MDYNDIEIPAWEIQAAFAKVGLVATAADIEKYGTVPRKDAGLYEYLSAIEAVKTISVKEAYQAMYVVADADNIRYWLAKTPTELAEFVAASNPVWMVPQYGQFLPNGGATPNNVQWRSFVENGVQVDKEISDADYAQALYSDALAAHVKKAAALGVDIHTGKPL